jgi:hypothetical protein
MQQRWSETLICLRQQIAQRPAGDGRDLWPRTMLLAGLRRFRCHPVGMVNAAGLTLLTLSSPSDVAARRPAWHESGAADLRAR